VSGFLQIVGVATLCWFGVLIAVILMLQGRTLLVRRQRGRIRDAAIAGSSTARQNPDAHNIGPDAVRSLIAGAQDYLVRTEREI
jgi:hypothetical protein